MILLCVPPLARLDDLGGHFALVPLVVDFAGDFLGDGLLLGGMIKNATAVLRARVHALPVRGGRVVHPIEEGQEGRVADFGGVEVDLEGFCVCTFPKRGG